MADKPFGVKPQLGAYVRTEALGNKARAVAFHAFRGVPSPPQPSDVVRASCASLLKMVTFAICDRHWRKPDLPSEPVDVRLLGGLCCKTPIEAFGEP